MKTRFHSGKKGRGFTLIELMVAMAITAIIVTVLVSISAVAIDAWQRGRSEVRASRQAKAFLDNFARDFESAVLRRGNTYEWLFAETVQSPTGPSANKSTNASDLIFLTSATDRYLGKIGTSDDKGGDVSCVSYHLEFQDPVKGTANGTNEDASTFVMYRALINPDETFEDILGKDNLSTAFQKYKSKLTDVENFVCENVYQFTLTFEVEVTQVQNGTQVQVPVRVTLGDNAPAGKFRVLGTGIDTDASTGSLKPTVSADELKAGRLIGAEVGITILTDSAIKRLAQDGLKDEVRKKILAQESFHYSRSVAIPSM